MIGQTISHYRVVEKLGGGGMGVVYRAEDTRLGRQVALKFLPEHVAQEQVILDRFRREARAASAINHPHICTVYDIGEENGQPFLAMEFLEGVTLKERIAAGPIPLESTIEWSIQIVDALDAAHAAGIIHRDIKPANLFITNRGQAKVLDFGLAKVAASKPALASSDVTQTVSFDHTASGSTMGTIAYMSPEQARGEELDGRSDIFSFGAVLYEMCTGKQPFEGRTPAVVFHAVLSVDPPPVSSLRPEAPAELDSIVRRCLARNSADRYGDAAELLIGLRLLNRDVTLRSVTPGQSLTASRRTARLWIVGIAALLLLASISATVRFRVFAPPQPPRAIRAERATANPSDRPVTGAAISPDGQTIAYSDPGGIRLYSVDTREVRNLPDTAGMTVRSWAHDGRTLLAMRQEVGQFPELLSISLLGGVQPIDWKMASPDGRYAFEHRTSRVSDAGGSNARRIVPDGPPVMFAAWSPDSSRLAYAARSRQGTSLSAFNVRSGTNQVLDGPFGNYLGAVSWASTEEVVYVRGERPERESDMNLWSVPVHRRSGARTSEPVRLTDWEGAQITALNFGDSGKSGVVVRAAAQTDVYLATAGANGRLAGEPVRFTFDDRNDRPSGWSADGKAVLFASDRNGTWDVFRQLVGSDTAEPIGVGPERQVVPRSAPDGSIVFVAWPSNADTNAVPARLMILRPGSAVPEELATIPDYGGHRCGGSLCIIEQQVGPTRIVSELSTSAGKGKELFRHDRRDGEVAISPDGESFAWFLAGPGPTRIVIVDVSGKVKREVQIKGAAFLRSLDWRHDGKGFFAGSELIGKGAALLSIDFNGNVQVVWQRPATQVVWAVPSPVGRYVALLGSTRESNVWMLRR
ncbi:MAG TPA: protein kinase [Bryobacteraceae bacterium]|nr:protein kinase [Bryobacteraceae bacterium]